MSILPLMAIITSAGIFEISNKNKKRIVITLICVVAFIQFFIASYGGSEYKYAEFYRRIYNEYNDISKKFVNSMLAQNKSSSNIIFISESSPITHYLLLMLDYLMMKNWPDKGSFSDLGNYKYNFNFKDKFDFIILALDRRHFLRIVHLLEKGRESLDKKLYLNLCRKYLFYEDWSLCFASINPKEFDNYIYNITQLVYKEKNKKPLEIYERLLILEAIKRKMLDIKEAEKLCRGTFNDLALWSEIYNERGIDGLTQDLTLSHQELMFLLQEGRIDKPLFRDERWEWLYKNIVDYQLIMVEHGEIPSLGIDFYLFKRNKN